MTSYGKVKVKKINPELSDVPDDCGYMQKFKYNIDMASNGPAGEILNPKNHWENQNAYMSFERKTDATMFWLSVGAEHIGRKE